jgi:hypothetical protein
VTADCPVCGQRAELYRRRTEGGTVLALIVHPSPDSPGRARGCWGALQGLGLEDLRAAVAIRDGEGDRLRLAAHP